ncbi:MAG: hypothetical protein SGILL_006766 [Bacillariaceae sp.]
MDDAAGWKQYLTDKYVQKKYAPKTKTMFPTPATPTSPAKKRASSRKFANLPMPDIDLIHFDNDNISTKMHTTPMNSPSTPARRTVKASPLGSPNTSKDFFADFGL